MVRIIHSHGQLSTRELQRNTVTSAMTHHRQVPVRPYYGPLQTVG